MSAIVTILRVYRLCGDYNNVVIIWRRYTVKQIHKFKTRVVFYQFLKSPYFQSSILDFSQIISHHFYDVYYVYMNNYELLPMNNL